MLRLTEEEINKKIDLNRRLAILKRGLTNRYYSRAKGNINQLENVERYLDNALDAFEDIEDRQERLPKDSRQRRRNNYVVPLIPNYKGIDLTSQNNEDDEDIQDVEEGEDVEDTNEDIKMDDPYGDMATDLEEETTLEEFGDIDLSLPEEKGAEMMETARKRGQEAKEKQLAGQQMIEKAQQKAQQIAEKEKESKKKAKAMIKKSNKFFSNFNDVVKRVLPKLARLADIRVDEQGSKTYDKKEYISNLEQVQEQAEDTYNNLNKMIEGKDPNTGRPRTNQKKILDHFLFINQKTQNLQTILKDGNIPNDQIKNSVEALLTKKLQTGTDQINNAAEKVNINLYNGMKQLLPGEIFGQGLKRTSTRSGNRSKSAPASYTKTLNVLLGSIKAGNDSKLLKNRAFDMIDKGIQNGYLTNQQAKAIVKKL